MPGPIPAQCNQCMPRVCAAAPSPVHQGPEGCLGERHGVGTQSQISGGTTVRLGNNQGWFNLGTEDRWQCRPVQGRRTTVGALHGWHVGIENGLPLGICWGHWAEDHVSQEGGLGQVEWQEHPQPGEVGPRKRGGVWSLWGSVSPGCAVPTVAMSLSCPT